MEARELASARSSRERFPRPGSPRQDVEGWRATPELKVSLRLGYMLGLSFFVMSADGSRTSMRAERSEGRRTGCPPPAHGRGPERRTKSSEALNRTLSRVGRLPSVAAQARSKGRASSFISSLEPFHDSMARGLAMESTMSFAALSPCAFLCHPPRYGSIRKALRDSANEDILPDAVALRDRPGLWEVGCLSAPTCGPAQAGLFLFHRRRREP